MGAMVLACGRAEAVRASAVLVDRPDVTVHVVPERPGKADVDHLLAQVGPTGEYDRAVVVGHDADLAAVVLRLLRTNRLSKVPIGFASLTGDSDAATVWGLPRNGDQALELALTNDPARVPLVRDGNGGVLVGQGRIGPLRGIAYCDEVQVLRGPARRIRVAPHSAGIQVTVTPSGLFPRPAQTVRCRAFELGCLPTVVVRDGVQHDRPVHRWHWYRHAEDLRLIGV